MVERIDRHDLLALLQLCNRTQIFLVDLALRMQVSRNFRRLARELVAFLHTYRLSPLHIIVGRELRSMKSCSGSLMRCWSECPS